MLSSSTVLSSFHARLARRRALVPAAVLVASALIAAESAKASSSATPDEHASPDTLGMLVENFALGDADGQDFVLYDGAREIQGTVLIFTGVECPIAKLLLPRLVEFSSDYAELGIRFIGIDPNVQDSASEVRERMELAGVEFPVLLDPFQVVADRLGVVRTPEALLLDRDFRLVYRGAIDDQYNIGASRPAPRNHWLLDAIESLLAGDEIETPYTEAPGCLIGRVGSVANLELTYHENIAPILEQRCVDCHRPGQVGPMPFVDYADAHGWAGMIGEVVEQGRMPPWHADPLHGEFENRRFVTETERATLLAWIENGAPEGDPEQHPAPPEFNDEGWDVGTPDHVVQLPEEQIIPADGVVPYRYVVVDPGLEEDHWVQAVEIRPTATAATHHVLVLTIPPGKTGRDALRGLGAGGDFVDGGYFAVQVPGNRPNVYPKGCGKFLPAGTQFLFQLHYTPTGIQEEDQTELALYWCDEEPSLEVKTTGIHTLALDIPPGKKGATFLARRTFDRPIRLLSMFPHMHSRGTAFKFELVGSVDDRILLDVPRYDFNWQNFYRVREPVLVGAGETILCTAVYDNSWDNPHNPDASERVRWGDQTFEEMMIGYIDYYEVPSTEAGG